MAATKSHTLPLAWQAKTVKYIPTKARPKRIVALAPVDGTAALELIPLPTQTRHLVMVEHRLQAHGLFHHTEIHPVRHRPCGSRSDGPSMVTVWQ